MQTYGSGGVRGRQGGVAEQEHGRKCLAGKETTGEGGGVKYIIFCNNSVHMHAMVF